MYTLRFFLSSKYSLFHNCNVFGSCIIHILYTECAKIKNKFRRNDPYRGRTAPLTSKRCILYIYSTNKVTEYFKHGIYSSLFFSLQNAVCFIILTYLVPVLFIFCIQGVLKLKKVIPAPKCYADIKGDNNHLCYKFTAELPYLSPLLNRDFKPHLSGISELGVCKSRTCIWQRRAHVSIQCEVSLHRKLSSSSR